MAKIFVAYSRKDQHIADAIVKVLREGHGVQDVWYDTSFTGDGAWWTKILGEIGDCKLFLYLVSDSSLESKFCQHELREAMRLQKQVLPIIVRAKTDVPGNIADDLKPVLRRTQVIDLASGVSDHGAVSRMHETIKMRLEQAPSSAPDPLLPKPTPAPPVSSTETKEAASLSPQMRLAIAALGIAMIIIIAVILLSSGDNDNDGEVSESVDVQPTATLQPTPTDTPLPPTPNPFEMALESIDSNEAWEPVNENIDGIDMVLVPVGCFMMGREDGDDNERPVHNQCINTPFWLDQTEVSRANYAACVNARVCDAPEDNPFSTQDTQPINKVSWFDARDYCVWRGARLPTEAEWEYAARGPDNLVYPWGNDFEADNVVVNVSEIADVGSKPSGASWVGAMDLSGNVWEWTSTISPFELVYLYPYVPDDGREAAEDQRRPRVVRGGSYDHSASFVQAANRGRSIPSVGVDNYGFRCAMTFSN